MPERPPLPQTRLARWALLLALPLAASCGGGVFIGIGGDDNRPPSISLAVTPEAAQRGQTLQLLTAASDDYGIDYVEFYRLDSGGAVLLGVDGFAPFSFVTTVPMNAPGSLQFLARAVDGARQAADSRVFTVTVLP